MRRARAKTNTQAKRSAKRVVMLKTKNKIRNTKKQKQPPPIAVEAKIATVIVFLSICTAMLGAALVILGKAGMASAVSYLPMPVVSGYLAYIGFFCLQAGLALCSGKVCLLQNIHSLHSHTMEWNNVCACFIGLYFRR